MKKRISALALALVLAVGALTGCKADRLEVVTDSETGSATTALSTNDITVGTLPKTTAPATTTKPVTTAPKPTQKLGIIGPVTLEKIGGQLKVSWKAVTAAEVIRVIIDSNGFDGTGNVWKNSMSGSMTSFITPKYTELPDVLYIKMTVENSVEKHEKQISVHLGHELVLSGIGEFYDPTLNAQIANAPKVASVSNINSDSMIKYPYDAHWIDVPSGKSVYVYGFDKARNGGTYKEAVNDVGINYYAVDGYINGTKLYYRAYCKQNSSKGTQLELAEIKLKSNTTTKILPLTTELCMMETKDLPNGLYTISAVFARKSDITERFTANRLFYVNDGNVWLCSGRVTTEEGAAKYKADERRTSAYFTDQHAALKSARFIGGKTLLVSIFCDDPDSTWSGENELMHEALDRVTEAAIYLNQEVKKYSESAHFLYNWEMFPDLKYNAKFSFDKNVYDDYTPNVYPVEKKFIEANIDADALLRKYDADNIIYLFITNSRSSEYTRCYALGSSATYDCSNETYYTEHVNVFFVRGTNKWGAFAHEILHCFCAQDLYTDANVTTVPDAYKKHLDEINSPDIMRDSHRTLPQITDITAYYLGLLETHPDIAEYGLQRSNYSR